MFLKILENLMNERGITNISQLSKLSGVPYMTLKNFWKQGYENIKLSTLRQLTGFFEVSLDYLIYGVDNQYNKNELLITEKNERELIKNYRDLSDQGKEYILQTMDMAVMKYKKDNSVSENNKEIV